MRIAMADRRREIINQLHELNILLLHTKLKATRAKRALRANSRLHGEASPQGTPSSRQLHEHHVSATSMLDCLTEDELSTLSELLRRIIDNTDTKLLDEEIAERRKAIHEFLTLNHTGRKVQE